MLCRPSGRCAKKIKIKCDPKRREERNKKEARSLMAPHPRERILSENERLSALSFTQRYGMMRGTVKAYGVSRFCCGFYQRLEK